MSKQDRPDRGKRETDRGKRRPDRVKGRPERGKPHVDRRVADAVYRNSFGAFVYAAFKVVNPGTTFEPNWHIDCVCQRVETMVNGRKLLRLVLNQPPRTLKSFIVSVALPAWLLGRDPSTRIICASYSQDLANKFSRDCRKVIENKFYKQIFPNTKLDPKKTAETEFETTRGGYRYSTSVGGTLTGRGCNVMIIDDPSKADDANSVAALQGASDWFHNTAVTRLDNPATSIVIVTQQRLHVNDLSGNLIEAGWRKLVLPAIATEAEDYSLADGETRHRPIGELLQPARDKLETLEDIRRQSGSRVFSAQYQQNPIPPDGNLIKATWLQRYPTCLERKGYRRVVLTCDPAGKTGPRNDYTAITITGVIEKEVHLLHVARGHWSILQMQDQIVALSQRWNVDLAVIEDTSSGMGLIQLLREQSRLNVIGRHPKDDKETRMCRHQGRFEAGRILLPKEASWLADFENEVLAFPNGRHDDQVDAFMLFLDWFSENEPNINQRWVGPIWISRAEAGLEPLIGDWSCRY
jgi:predicted phage terminase large subunit-like protein